MPEQLTPDQIKTIDDFVKARYVKYDDVRMELIDHLATEIESEANNNPAVSFGSLLHKVMEKYGPELSKLVKEKERQLRRYWIKLIAKESLKSIFSIYILLPLAVYYITLHLSMIMSAFFLIVIILLIIFLGTGRIDNAVVREESSRFIASKTFNGVTNVFYVLWSLVFIVGYSSDSVFTVGLISINLDSLLFAFAIAYTLITVMSLSLLDAYYQKFPAIEDKRKAFHREYANRKWYDR